MATRTCFSARKKGTSTISATTPTPPAWVNKPDHLPLRAGRLLAAALLLCAAAALAPPIHAQDRVEVGRVVVADPEVDGGAGQLVQVTLRNNTRATVSAGVRAEILDANDRATGVRAQRVVSLAGTAQERVFFQLRAPARPGPYTVRVVVLTPDFRRHLLAGSPTFSAEFTVVGVVPPPAPATPPPGAPAAPGSAATAGSAPVFQAPAGLEFDKPDLLWENFLVAPASVLLGETIIIKADLRNVGGDIARAIGVEASFFNTRLPGRVTSITSSSVDVLAPGEKLELEFAYQFDRDALLGDYKFVLAIDPAGSIAESNEDNNRRETEQPVRLSHILLTFPEPGFVFDEAGLFLFRWRSNRFNEFKVQVGTEARFENKENFFDLPQGEKWTPDQEVVPLPGELPDMLLGLMIQNEADTAYWRVVGREQGTDRVGFSLPWSFKIGGAPRAKAADPANPPPAAGRTGTGRQPLRRATGPAPGAGPLPAAPAPGDAPRPAAPAR